MTWQGVSEAECYDNRSVIAQIVRIKDRLTAVEQNVDPTLREDLTAAIAELTALENTVGNVETQVEANTGNITTLQTNVGELQTDIGELETEVDGKADTTTVDAALALKANAADVDADLELKADKTQLTDGSVTKLGTATIGSGSSNSSLPIYWKDGEPKPFVNEVVSKGATNTRQTIKGYLSVNTYGWFSVSKQIPAGSSAKWIRLTTLNAENREDYHFRACNLKTNELAMVELATNVNAYGYKAGSSGISVVVRPILDANLKSHFDVFFRIAQTSTVQNVDVLYNIIAEVYTAVSLDSTLYDDVAYSGITIPNVTNYGQYDWYELTSGQWTALPKASHN